MFHPNRLQYNARTHGVQVHPRFWSKLKFYFPLRGAEASNATGGTVNRFLDVGPTRYVGTGIGTSYGQIAMDASGPFLFNVGDPLVADYMPVTNSGSDPVTGPHTLMAWTRGYVSASGSVLGNSGQRLQPLMKVASGTDMNAGLFVYTDNNVYYQFTVGGSYRQCKTTGGTHPPTNAWHHIAGVYDGAELRLYVDGVLAASVAGSGTPDAGGSQHWYIGRDNVLGGVGGGGYRDVAVWDRALTAADISFAYTNRDLMLPSSMSLAYVGSVFPSPAPLPVPDAGGPYVKVRHGGTSHGATARAESSEFTVGYADFFVEVDTTGGDVNGYLFPWATQWQNREVVVKNIGANDVIMGTYDAANIDSAATVTIAAGTATRFCAGTDRWRVI